MIIKRTYTAIAVYLFIFIWAACMIRAFKVPFKFEFSEKAGRDKMYFSREEVIFSNSILPSVIILFKNMFKTLMQLSKPWTERAKIFWKSHINIYIFFFKKKFMLLFMFPKAWFVVLALIKTSSAVVCAWFNWLKALLDLLHFEKLRAQKSLFGHSTFKRA